MSEKCPGSTSFPTNFDGESSKCDKCGRVLTLTRQGLLPTHPPKDKRRHELLPSGEYSIDGRRGVDGHRM